MKLLKVISILALAGILATSPALAQTRDGRDDQPQVNNGSDHGSTAGDEVVKWKLPKSTRGITCTPLEDGILYAKLTNGTGATIPAGSVVTLYIDPGEQVRHITLKYDWLPGATLKIGVSDNLDLEIACSAKVKLSSDGTPGNPPAGDYVPFKPGDVGAIPRSHYPFTCQMVDGGVLLTNTGNTTIPADSHIRWTTDLYSSGAYVPSDIPPGGSVFFSLDDLPAQFQQRVGAECWPQGIDLPSP
jgi:hypothetical protein